MIADVLRDDIETGTIREVSQEGKTGLTGELATDRTLLIGLEDRKCRGVHEGMK